jgi:hypothetical protein
MIKHKNEEIKVNEYSPEGFWVEDEGKLDFGVSASNGKAIYEASCEKYGFAFAQSPQQAVDLVKDLIDRKKR